ncbi:hypothetical protein TVAG_373200 [Trichomonas vaginalis G3]|uniref:Uncharacterized protein n=2 Tax=Trichomonas vaginalis (strain ATCC PRA-98 / G3) TaxID=412133 RepID=A2DZI3_TRIV3|nr:hypothetical protein TVAGG3_1055160 [Trichomonas vaginalis G3]XP_051085280.1 hypothetical protein TVAGG3_0864270 [Trichomonas vaginalis G3]XP_051093862.1 hypothetical protein TVAGG3_0485830 [Trichomonas vaginalis G3]XP_051096027.1 hypothetical protein TVAGG3_0552860 [Trichomonas vaginalis G3]XP_051106492.1 hypothetical protein TVAGG3_0063820 [Trichomonas vaginalis G3]XP_051112780.1 hypothetical protein TVAGG3_0244420 [Trichomonas vaginalis G3]EAX66867.1 hypothetical protein TVAG_534480 [Tr|eukprot:XP_001279797.1 hypothetical protein [Trichomonas vaginalis G3]
MRRRFTSQKNTNAKAEITVGYNVNDDKSRIIQNVKVNVSPELTRSATQPNLLTRDLPKNEENEENHENGDPIILSEPGKEPVEIPTYPTYPPPLSSNIENPGIYDSSRNAPYKIDINSELMKIYRDIITDNYDSIINLIDQSGLIILPYESLIHIIAILCDVQDSDVKIQFFIDDEVSCCGTVAKINPIKDISTIKISKNGTTTELHLTYNDIYNKIVDEYKISLEKFFVKAI